MNIFSNYIPNKLITVNDKDPPWMNEYINPLSANPIKRSNTLKQFISKLLTNCLSVFNHFVKLALKELSKKYWTKKLHKVF